MKRGETPLHKACEVGSIEAVKCLIKHGAHIDVQANVIHLFYIAFFYVRLIDECQMKYMPIHCAASRGSLPILKYFIELGVDVSTKANVSIVNIDSLYIYAVIEFHPKE